MAFHGINKIAGSSLSLVTVNPAQEERKGRQWNGCSTTSSTKCSLCSPTKCRMLALLGHWNALGAAAAAKEVQEQRFKAENCRNQGGGRDRIIVTDNYSTTAPPAHKTALKARQRGCNCNLNTRSTQRSKKPFCLAKGTITLQYHSLHGFETTVSLQVFLSVQHVFLDSCLLRPSVYTFRCNICLIDFHRHTKYKAKM